MDRWEACIEDYQRSLTLDSLSALLHTAEGILKEDLADFEFDWFIQTLLSEPVSLLDTISARLSDAAWSKVVRDSYKLLSDLVENHYDKVKFFAAAIIKECQKPQDARTRAHAIQCLTSCAKHAFCFYGQDTEHASEQEGMYNDPVGHYVRELGTASTCKGPLALLVGAICESHPEFVTDHINTIWRTFLKLLGSNKNSDLVCKSLLKGVWGLFKNFGTDIPTRELTEFYDQLTREFLSRCETAVLHILRDYAPLFKEKLASDGSLRRELWTIEDLSAILPVYEETCKVLSKEQLQKILQTEIVPKTKESYYKTKFTALRVCVLLRRYGVSVDSLLNVDVYSLEFQLRNEVSYEVCEAVLWSIESNMANSEKLLQTSILFYHNLPANGRKDVVVTGLLNSPMDVMSTTLNFLLTETCQDACLPTYLPLWRDIFDSQLADKKQILFEKFIDNYLIVIDNFLEDSSCEKKLPEKLASLLTLTSHVLSYQPAEDTSDLCALVSSKLVELTRECGLEAPIVAVARSLTSHLDDDDGVRKIYKMIQIDKCKDEALLCESCLALIQETEMTDAIIILKALEVIFSRKDAEPKTLSLAIKKLDKLIVKENNNLDKRTISTIIQLVQKLRDRKDMVGKDARVLKRDVAEFLGKYYSEECDSESTDNSLIVKLKEVLTLDVPNPVEGNTYKIKLSGLLHLAIVNEHEESLRMLINIICANLCTNTSPLLQAALGRVLVSLCRATVGATQPKVARHAASFCDVDATLYILQQINEEKSPAVRRMLSDTVESILLKEPGSQANEVLLKAVYKEVCRMMSSDNSILKLGGLDITESLLTSLKVNRHQTKDMLPTLLLLISNTYEQDSCTVFENASNLFTENIALFNESVLNNTIDELLKILLKTDHEITNDMKALIHRNIVKSTLNFVKKLSDQNEGITSKLLEFQAESDCVKYVFLWSEVPKHFDVKIDVIEDIMCMDNSKLLERVFNEDDFDKCFVFEAHLKFLNQYAAVLLKSYCMETLNHIGNIIKKLTPPSVRIHRALLSEFLTHCKQILHLIPDVILKSFERWTDGLPLKDITEHIEKDKFETDHAISVNALNIMLDIFRLKDPTFVLTTVGIFAKTWTKTVLRIYANGHIKYFRKQVPYLTDLLSVSFKFLTVTDVKNILSEGRGLQGAANENIGVEFGRFFIGVFVKYLVKKPFLMLQDGMEGTWVLLNDIVKWCVRKRWQDWENVLELVDQLWPTYETKATFKSKHALLLALSCAGVRLDVTSRAMCFARSLVSSDDAPRDDRIALVGVLPGGEECSEAYRSYAASLLPTRLSDMDGVSRAALRALLDALAGNADSTLLEIVITLADGDDTSGWWDEALSSCMASLGRLPATLDMLLAVFRRTASVPVCSRLLVPLLRNSPSSICEKFFASILKDTLHSLSSGIKTPSLHPEYRACVQQKTITLDILQVIFEKLAASKIESPSSSLYEHIQTDKPWHLAREVIRVCYKLRDKLLTPDGATSTLARVCREFQCSAYKCMCTCVCVRRPDAQIYGTVFEANVWSRLVDDSAIYELPLKTERNKQKFRKTVSIAVKSTGSQSRSLSRTRVFLRTLSENPLDYDLIDYREDDIDAQDVELTDSSLNKHPCAAILTALFEHASDLSHYKWRESLNTALTTSGRNVKWLLAEAVCNCKEVLKSHATELRAGLLAVIADTNQGGLNSLHIDILNTLIHWSEDIELSTTAVSHLNIAVNSLVDTALKNSTRINIFRMLEDVLENFLRVYGRYTNGELSDIDQYLEDSTRTKSCLKLLLRFAKNNVRVQNLLDLLLEKLEKYHRVYRTEMTLLAELIGIEITNSNERAKNIAAAKLKNILEEVKSNKISDYVKILHCSGFCSPQQFRTIVDTTQKLPEADKKKCLRIISTYISQHPDSPETAEIPPDIRQMADRISGDRHFEELFSSSPQITPPASKRARTDTSPILNTIGRNEKAISEALSRLRKERVAKVCEKLCQTDMTVRFVECFYLAIYLPVKYPCGDRHDLSVCMSTFLHMLFNHLKALKNFRDRRLRDEPLVLENPIGLTKSRTNRMVGTLRSYSYTSNRYLDHDTESEIDVQVSIEKILDTFMEFAKVTPDASIELITQLLRCLGRGFDSRPVLAQLLSLLLAVAPELVVIARECVDQLYLINGFSKTVAELKKSTLGTEGEQLFRILFEEIQLRCEGNEQFVLGITLKEDASMAEDKDFSIEELVTAFQKLSNWDELTIQDKNRIEMDLPILWTDRDQFKELVEEYTEYEGWFGKMIRLYRDDKKDVMKWLRSLDRWPRRYYVNSSVMEAIQWHSEDHHRLQIPTVIQKNDCLAEWAARLMLRCAYLTDTSGAESTKKLSRSHELLWCESANERGLHQSALSVVKRNCLDDLEEDETLQWMEQKMFATTAIGLKSNDISELEKALNISNFLPEFYEHSTPDAIIGVNALKMKLHFNLESLSSSRIDEVMIVVKDQIERINEKNISSSKIKKNLADLYGTAILYYDGMWSENESNDEILLHLCEYLGKLRESKLDVAGVAAIILNRLRGSVALNDTLAITILAQFKPIISKLPSCYLDQLKASLSLFPPQVVRASAIPELKGEPAMEKYMKCLQLLCDADYLLLQYCEELDGALRNDDPTKWDVVFNRMKNRIFENEYKGTDYKALITYRKIFNDIQNADTSMKRLVLKGVILDLKSKQPRETIRLSHVCPTLVDLKLGGLSKILRLPPGIEVVKIEEELGVFIDSVRRPCVLSALTTDGRRRRYLLKNEDLRADAAVSNINIGSSRGYAVIPLSEDCGLIEFLEDHMRIRELIAKTFNINDINIERQATKEEELILAPKSSSIQNYNAICAKFPAFSLRSAIENHSSSVQDFIMKKRRFLETLSDITIVNWLFGLGDRHLQNLLYSVQDGGLQCIDWGAILQYGVAELPPARLTRNMLAVCDTAVLESRIQAVLTTLRESRHFIIPVLKISFRWMENFDEKLIYINGILQGTMVAYDITKDVIQKSNKLHKLKYIELLEKVFVEFSKKDIYSVDEQDSADNSMPHYGGGAQESAAQTSPDPCGFQPAAQRFRLNEQRIKLLTSINTVVQQRADLESNRLMLSNQLDDLRRKLRRRIEECHLEKKDRMKALKQANQRLEKEKFNVISEIEHLKRHLQKEELHHMQHARTAVAQAIQGVVTKTNPPEHFFSSCSMADLPNVVSRSVARNAPSRVADNKLAAARLMRDIAELRQRVAQVEARLSTELKRKRQAELDIIRLRKELSATKSCVASLRIPPGPLRKQCSKFA